MNSTKSLESEIFDKLENTTTKIGKKVYDVLDNHEGIAGIFADTKTKVFWFTYSSGNNCPAYVYKWLKRYIKRKYGYSFLLDIASINRKIAQ